MEAKVILDARYTADLLGAMQAGETWCEGHPEAVLAFADMPGNLLSSLDQVADELAQGDPESRAFLQVLIDATEGRCTFQQARCVIVHLLDRLGSHRADA